MRHWLRAVICALVVIAIGAPANARDLPPMRKAEPPIAVAPVERAKWNRTTPEQAYLGVRAANLAHDAEWILAGFTAADRPTVSHHLANAEMRRANARIQRNIESETIIGTVSHKDHVILVIQAREKSGTSYRRFVPMLKTGDGWAVSNALKDDAVFKALLSSPPAQ